MEWNASLYDDKHRFVAEYGKDLLECIPHDPEQAILDLGCGTGILTARLFNLGNRVVGIDSSHSMIEKAKDQFPEIEFRVCNALDLPFEQEFDVVFSNAVFHWIDDHDLLIKNIYKSLHDGGLLICEFGAHGNIKTIEIAFSEICNTYGYHYISGFNFPTVDDFAQMLEKNKLKIEKIYAYDRPTVLSDGEHGLVHWMKQFFSFELVKIPMDIQNIIFEKMEKVCRNTIWNGKEWVADYRRLRAIAHK